ncbi:MAG TPA: aminoglycoside phosphotransferase family protein [Myxococcaceae bacterium]|jgi:aminoglycoside phosphotransferase (APT) family kinase protein
MDSRTKRRLEPGQIEAMVRHALGSQVKVASSRELTDGFFNASYALELSEGPPVVLKVAPPPEVPILTYEHGIMRTEIELYERVRRETSCPVPRVIASDLTRSILSSDYFFMEKLRGAPLNKAKGRLSRGELAGIQEELGGIVRRLGSLRAERFGYPREEARAAAPTWREAFLAMVSNLLEDAGRYQVKLPLPAERILDLFRARAGALDAVKVPVLTHFDLWEGNVFILREGGGPPRVEAIIDGERAFWGDPCAELVSVVLFGDMERASSFLRGYQAATGAPLAFTENLRERLLLYRAYLYLIMVIEAAPRGYKGLTYALMHAFFRYNLRGILRKLRAR